MMMATALCKEVLKIGAWKEKITMPGHSERKNQGSRSGEISERRREIFLQAT